nr:NADH dehydrogenase subunit 5 [Eutomostethus vegetus]
MLMDLCLIMTLIFMLNWLIFFSGGVFFLFKNLTFFIEYNIFNLNSCSIVMTFLLDWMSLMFLSVVFFISMSVVYYSKFYMNGDLNINRFILLIFMFVLSMFLLIISPNLISILLGWDGLGLISYCLVIYYQNEKSFNAGMLTVLSNRVGDVFLLVAIAWMMNFGGWNYIFYVDFLNLKFEVYYILLLILLASFTKSAQIPFSSWLPAAMAAPTPVSSLVHSSTLVTAGVYLLIRFEKMFFMNNDLIKWFLLLSMLTMFMSGLNANFEYDLKKIIALSTLSQLGLMLSTLFLGFKEMTFFHLLTHALFKALLFMCAGIIIHNLMNFQDIRYMGSISFQLPLVSSCFNFANLSLCGFPFLAGFYSKDLILEKFFFSSFNLLVLFLMIMSTLMTVMYTFRLIYFSMILNFSMLSLNFLNEFIWGMNKSLFNLMVMVIFSGSMMSWLIFPYPSLICLPFFFKILPIQMIIWGVLLSYINLYMNLNVKFKNIFNFYFMKYFFTLMWFLPILSTYGLIKQPLLFSKKMSLMIDQNWTEMIIGRSLIKNLKKYSIWLDLLIYFLNFFLMMLLFFMLIWFNYFCLN